MKQLDDLSIFKTISPFGSVAFQYFVVHTFLQATQCFFFLFNLELRNRFPRLSFRVAYWLLSQAYIRLLQTPMMEL